MSLDSHRLHSSGISLLLDAPGNVKRRISHVCGSKGGSSSPKTMAYELAEGASNQAYGEAISRIERLLTTPFAVDDDDASITLSDLRTRCEWDPLRSDPRFQRILVSPEPKTVYK